MKHSLFLFLAMTLLLLGCFDGKQAVPNWTIPSFSGSEFEIIESDSTNYLLAVAIKPEFVNYEGAAIRNQDKFLEISAQRVSVRIIMRGIAESDSAFIEKGVKAIEYGFAHQNEDGSFQYDSSVIELGAIEADLLEAGSFFMQAVARSYLLISDSDFSEEFLPRLDLLKPKMRLTIEWLKNNKTMLYEKAKNAPNRLLFDALAFKLSGIILEEESYASIACEFLNENLKRQREDGVFLEEGGYDSSYQAVNILKLQHYYLYSEDAAEKEIILSAVDKAVEWEKTRIKSTGEVDDTGNARTGSQCLEKIAGRCKEINYTDVAMSFSYYSVIRNDVESSILVKKIVDYAVANS